MRNEPFQALEPCVYVTRMKMCEGDCARAVCRKMCVRQVSVCTSAPIHQTIIQETILKANLSPTSQTNKCRAPGCKPSCFCGKGPCRSRFGSHMWLLECRLVCFFLRRERAFSMMRKEAPLSTTCIPSFDFMIGCGVDVFASSVGETPRLRKTLFILKGSLWSCHALCRA